MNKSSNDWASTRPPENTSPNARLPWLPAEENTQFGPRPMNGGDVELNRLGGYAMVIALMAACMLLSAWSRIDLRETAVALDRSERAYTATLAETTRLELELSTLEDPVWLSQTANNLSLQTTVPVVDLTQTPQP